MNTDKLREFLLQLVDTNDIDHGSDSYLIEQSDARVQIFTDQGFDPSDLHSIDTVIKNLLEE